MRDERELRKVIALLVKICMKHHIRAMALNSTLTWMMELPPSTRAALTPALLEVEAANFEQLAIPFVHTRALQLEEALSGDKEFLEILRAYASQQLWPRQQM